MTVRQILVLPGDGIGPDVVAQALKVLKVVAPRHGFEYTLTEAPIGGAGIEAAGVPLPEETLALAKKADAIFLGSVGDYQYDTLDPAIRPEQGLLQIRKALGLYANLRPVKLLKALSHTSTLKPEVIDGVDMVVVRELTGGLYFGQPKGRHADHAVDTLIYTHAEIERIARRAFDLAMVRRKKLCSVDKANVLSTSQAWREIVTHMAKEYPQVALAHMYVDNAAMQLILNPRQFDVILTENTFGDILSDEASMLSGSLGMLPSASLGLDQHAIYEPCHGSAPDLKGQNKVNPIAQILSLAMMLELSFDLPAAAREIEAAVLSVLESGTRTFDVMDPAGSTTLVGTAEMGDRIAEAVATLPRPVPA